MTDEPTTPTRAPSRRPTWVHYTTLAVAALTLALVAVVAIRQAAHTNAPAAPAQSVSVHTFRFVTEGDVTSVSAEYLDAYGYQDEPTINGDFKVSGLVWAVIAVYGTGPGCYMLLDGVAAGSDEGLAQPAQGVSLCVYRPVPGTTG